MVQVGVLEDHVYRARGHTIAAIGAFLFIHDIRTDLVSGDSTFGTYFFTFPALGAYHGFIFTGIGKLRFDPQGGFFRVDLFEVFDSTYLETQAAAGAIVLMNSYSQFKPPGGL
jgi:hypothetical protein